MGSISEQFRSHTGLEGEPDVGLGLENAKGKSGGKPVDTGERLDALHPAQGEDTKVETETGDRVAEKKAEHKETREKSKPSAKKAAAKKSTAKKK